MSPHPKTGLSNFDFDFDSYKRQVLGEVLKYWDEGRLCYDEYKRLIEKFDLEELFLRQPPEGSVVATPKSVYYRTEPGDHDMFDIDNPWLAAGSTIGVSWIEVAGEGLVTVLRNGPYNGGGADDGDNGRAV